MRKAGLLRGEILGSGLKQQRVQGRQQGYILALNIAVLALMLVVATYMGQQMTTARQLARAEQERVDAEYELESARAKVFMLLSTVPRSRRGLGLEAAALPLDGRYYRVGKKVLVSLQDARGLVAINGTTLGGFGRERIKRLLATYGIDAVEASKMTDALLDYRDSDDLSHLNGAEKEDYRHAGKADQIRNGDLLSTSELARVLGWEGKKKIWGADPITDYLSPLRVSVFNPNTAQWRALVAMSGISEELARNLVKSRMAGEIQDISPLVFSGSLNNPFGPNSFVSLFPAPATQVTLRLEGASWGYRMLVVHTPERDVWPWRLEISERVHLPELAGDPARMPELPEWTTLRDPTATAPKVQLPF